MGENHFASLPVAVYGLMLWLASIAYFVLTKALIAQHGAASPLALAIGRDRKGIFSMAVYAAAIPLAFWTPGIACAGYAVIALAWLLPESSGAQHQYGH